MAERAFNEFPSDPDQTARTRSSSQDEPMMEQAKHKAEEVKQEASEMFRSQADKGSTQAGEKVMSTAEDMRSVSETLREQGRDSAAKFFDQGAHQVERLAEYLRDSDTDTILRDAQDYARRQPWMVALGGLALGLFAARMVKAAGEAPYRPHSQTTRYSEASSRHLSAVPETSTRYEEGSRYGTGSMTPGSSYGYETGSDYERSDYERSDYETGTLGGSAGEETVEEEGQRRTGEAGGGRPF